MNIPTSFDSDSISNGLVTVVIPTLDEKVGIGQVISRIPREITNEIIVVDSSNDGTAEVARSHGATVIYEDRRGYGRALQTGIGNATGEIIVYIDADMTYDPREIPKLVFPILRDEFDVMLGNRLQGKRDPQAMKPLNRIGNTILSLVFSFISQKRVSDSQCGMRAIRRSLLEDLVCCDLGMPYVTEQLLKLIEKGARVGEVPISYRRRVGETKLVPWKDGLRILRLILKNLVAES